MLMIVTIGYAGHPKKPTMPKSSNKANSVIVRYGSQNHEIQTTSSECKASDLRIAIQEKIPNLSGSSYLLSEEVPTTPATSRILSDADSVKSGASVRVMIQQKSKL